MTEAGSFGDFRHRPLDLETASIRLVKVLRPGSDGTVRCSIRHVRLDDGTSQLYHQGPDLDGPQYNNEGVSLQYSCLSYVWGDPDDSIPISLNEQSFPVRRNLWRFLKEATRILVESANVEGNDQGSHIIQASLTSLWIDALCIDQANEAEKNHQVQQMGHIYRRADRVLAWIDNEEEEGIAAMFEFATGRSKFKRTPTIALHGQAITAFCKHDYWNRAWITQEVILARTLYYVTHRALVEASYMDSMARSLRKHAYAANICEEMWSSILEIRQPTCAHAPSLLDNVLRFKDKKCANILDKVYSLLAISCDGHHVKVDYGISSVQIARTILHLREGVALSSVFRLIDTMSLDGVVSEEDANMSFIEVYPSKEQPFHIREEAWLPSGRVLTAKHRSILKSIPLQDTHRNPSTYPTYHASTVEVKFAVRHATYLVAYYTNSRTQGLNRRWAKDMMPLNLELEDYGPTFSRNADEPWTVSLGLICKLMALIWDEEDSGAQATFYTQSNPSYYYPCQFRASSDAGKIAASSQQRQIRGAALRKSRSLFCCAFLLLVLLVEFMLYCISR